MCFRIKIHWCNNYIYVLLKFDLKVIFQFLYFFYVQSHIHILSHLLGCIFGKSILNLCVPNRQLEWTSLAFFYKISQVTIRISSYFF